MLLFPALLLGLASPARAQLDTPAAAGARRALRAAESAYGNRTEWAAWSRLLNLPDVEYELHAGESAQRSVLRAAVVELVGGRVPQFTEPAFERLAKALDVRAQELLIIPAADWPSACGAAAEHYEPITPESLEKERAALAARLEQFEAHAPAVRTAGSPWAVFLFWPQTRALAFPPMPAPAPDLAQLDRLETRWAAAPSVWDDEVLFDTSLAVRTYIRRLRGYLKGETREMHAAAWNELAELLVAYGSESRDTSKIAAAVSERESLGQASRLTASIRGALSRPNLIVQVRNKWLESELSTEIDEPYDVNGVFAGTYSSGRGRMVGTMRGEILPSSAVGQWVLHLRGTSTARTSGSQDRVYVVSRATTRVAGTKPFALDARGLAPRRALAGARTAIVYEQINASGLARRRERAVSETYARRPQAETESAAYARQSILDQMNEQAAKVAADFNRSYHQDFRDPRINSGRPAAEIRVRAADGLMEWMCRLEGPRTFAAASSPPPFDAASDVVMYLEASALEEQATAALAGRQMTADDLLKAMGPSLAKSSEKAAEEFNVSFDADPCDIRIADGTIHARLYVTKFDSEDVKYPAMTVDVAYQPQEREGQVVFVRQGSVRVTPIAQKDGDKPVLSGRQQTLKVAVQRKLGKVLTEELQWSEVKLPLGDEDETTLRLERAQVAAPWLEIGLSPQKKG